jgi:hypothetical protein
MLCVACHYSHKYGCSDDYVNEFSQDVEMQQYIFKLKNTKTEEIISQFVQEYLINLSQQVPVLSTSPSEEYCLKNATTTSDHSLSLKQMQYLWKEYLDIHNYPIGLYNLICKKTLTETTFQSQYNTEQELFVDVGAYFLPTSIAIQISPLWYRRARHPDEQPEVDRIIMQVLLQHGFTYDTNGIYSLNYRVGNREDSVKADFFIWGNAQMEKKYPEKFPWRK